MANIKFTDLSVYPSEDTLADGDKIAFVDIDDTSMGPSGTNKIINSNDLADSIASLMSESTLQGSKLAASSILSAKLSLGSPQWNALGNVSIGQNVSNSDLSLSIGAGRNVGGIAAIKLFSTSGPDADFTIQRNSGDAIVSISNDTGTNGGMQLKQKNGYISLSTGDNERLRVLNDGNIGIGTSTPSQKLEVVGTVKATAFDGPITGSVTGNASSATKLATKRAFSLTGDVTATAVDFDGTLAVSLTTSIPNATIKNAKIASDAAIAGTKITPAFGNQNISTSGTLTAGTSTISSTGNVVALKISQTGTADALVVEDSASDSTPFVVDSEGRVVNGHTSVQSLINYASNAYTPTFQIIGTTGSGTTSNGALGVAVWAANGDGPQISFAKSKSDAIGTHARVAVGDTVLALNGAGSDGINFRNAVYIRGEIDGTPGTNDMPGRLTFATTADSSSSPTERMRITSAGYVGIGATQPSAHLDIQNGTAEAQIRIGPSTAAGYIFGNASHHGFYSASGGQIYVNRSSPFVDISGTTVTSSNAAGGNTPLVVRNDNAGNNTTKTAGLLFQGQDTVGTIKSTAMIQCGPAESNYIGSYLAFQTRSADALSERMRIDSSGNVGIGTGSSAPAARLEVKGGTSNDANPEFRITGSSGHIDFHNSLTAGSYAGITSAGDKAIIFSDGTIDTGNLVIAPWATGTKGIRITKDGNVGIGKNAPTTALDVNGTVTATAFAGQLTGNVTGTSSGNIKQGGGTNQTANTIFMGWSNSSKLRVQVDVTDFGSTWPIDTSGNSSTATKLATARTLTIGNTGKTFDGSANVSWTHADLGTVRNLGVVTINPVAAYYASCTTAQFISWLTTAGAFQQTASVMKCSWSYSDNNNISDTGFGELELAGCIVETFTDGTQYIVRVTSPSTGTGAGGIHEYVNHGSVYSPGWRRVYTSALNGDVSGNAATATKLAAGKTIALSGDVTATGVSFDGSANITIATAIGSGVIVNDDVKSDAAIAGTKISPDFGNQTIQTDAGIIVGNASRRAVGDIHVPTTGVYNEGSGTNHYKAFVGVANRNDAIGAQLILGKSRGTTIGSSTSVRFGDILGSIKFAGADGTGMTFSSSIIESEVTAFYPINVNQSYPLSDIVFKTAYDNTYAEERMRIEATGRVSINDSLEVGSQVVAKTLLIDNTRPFSVDSDGTVICGDSLNSAALLWGGTARANRFTHQIIGGHNTYQSGSQIVRYSHNNTSRNYASTLALCRSNTQNIGGHVACVDDQILSIISGAGSDGVEFVSAAEIQFHQDGDPALDSIPGKISFCTRTRGDTNGADTRMTIRHDGKVGIGTKTPSTELEVNGTVNAAAYQVGTAPTFPIRAHVNFSATETTAVSFSVSRPAGSDIVTLTSTTDHGIPSGAKVWIDFNTAITDSLLTVTATSSKTLTAKTSSTTAASTTAKITKCTLRASGNVDMVTKRDIGDYYVSYAKDMPSTPTIICNSSRDIYAYEYDTTYARINHEKDGGTQVDSGLNTFIALV